MTDESDGDEGPLAPGEAFALLGHEIRASIVEVLATADRTERPLAFSTLRERVGTVDSAKFNYHLGELVGHFLERTDEGYDLRRAGERVAEAVLSGAVTDDPVLERTRIDQSCLYCGAPVTVDYRQEQVAVYCTECDGTYGASERTSGDDQPTEQGFLGYLSLPPVGIADRTAEEVHWAAVTWQLSEQLLAASGTCPRCSAALDEWLALCEDHAPADGRCQNCNERYAAKHSASCTNCVFARRGVFGVALLDHTALQSFLTDHGINLIAPASDRFLSVVMDYEETVSSVDPFEASFTFTVDGDALTLTVDDDLTVVDVARSDAR
ncbi:DUF7351 domain-containing protein [Halorarius halobius]|uniref:DUF7351 domain-containing protein n=1 Tax=Halorarius halobius TaxID=2962671 RepID=UPI0020CE4489|nr:hypothetical protein [Halorarius halobius]